MLGALRTMPTRPLATLSCACWRMPSTEEESFLLSSCRTSGSAGAGGTAGGALGTSAAPSGSGSCSAANKGAAGTSGNSGTGNTAAGAVAAVPLSGAVGLPGLPLIPTSPVASASWFSWACCARRFNASLSNACGFSLRSVASLPVSFCWLDTKCVAAVSSCVYRPELAAPELLFRTPAIKELRDPKELPLAAARPANLFGSMLPPAPTRPARLAGPAVGIVPLPRAPAPGTALRVAAAK
mmetsp:Transcript_65809/g.182353  ORF Transcript_65809/g.182353 Transcript_65809/m.182353 type:complete len:240 (-) Transcript_65809:573-1292(-)